VNLLNRIALDILSTMGMEPVPYIELAARLACRNVGMSTTPIVRIPEAYADWSMHRDPSLVKDVKAALREHGMSVQLGEGFILQPNAELGSFTADLDVLADVGTRRIAICCFGVAGAEAIDALAELAQMAADRGMGACIEFVPHLGGIGDLATAVDAVRQVGRDDFGLIIDTMHLFRSGASVADVAAVDPSIIKHVQICDVPWQATGDYAEECCFARCRPGEGNLPLEQLVRILPSHAILGVETPMRARVLAGEDPAQFLASCVAAVNRYIDSAEA
jgi:sugar phosphate isomerase/epimerase